MYLYPVKTAKSTDYVAPICIFLFVSCSILSACGQDNFTIVIGQNKTFNDFNFHNAWFENDPNNPPPWPDQREAYSTGNTAHVSLSATPGHAGEAIALIGVNATWDLGQHTWDQVKEWPLTVTFDLNYKIEANWDENNGSANALIQLVGPPEMILKQKGYEVGLNGTESGRLTQSYNTTVQGLTDHIWANIYCQAHSASWATSTHTSLSEINLNSIKVEFIEFPPNTPSSPIGPPCGSIGQEYVFMSMAEDPNGDDVQFIFDWGDNSTSDTEFVKSGMWKSAPHQWSNYGLYEVKVKAKNSKGAVSDWSEASTIHISAPPAKPLTPSGPDSGFKRTTYTFSTSAIDPDEGDQAKFTFDWGDGSTSETGFVNSGSTISESHRWSSSGTYQIEVMATDTCNVPSEWSDPMSITIVNRPPIKPSLSGPTNGYIKAAYLYSTQTIDPDEDDLRYNFYWRDGLVFPTGLVPSGTTVHCYHVWDNVGEYEVRTQAIDEEGASSELSDPLDVTISNTPPFNLPPNPPNSPSGPSYGYVGRTYNYLAYTIDPNGDLVKYSFDWGDGSTSETGFVDSGSSASGSHGWNSNGTYIVKAMATDSKGASSDWSDSINVSIANNPCISGTKFNDSNSNATRDPGEAGLSGWTIRLTRPDGTTINATTNAIGGYKFENLTAGTYRVSEVRQSNWTQTYPAWLGDHIINVTDGSVTGVDFGNNYLPVPDIPFPPAGPASGIPGAEYIYSTSSTDPSGYQIAYTFDWGDGTNSTTGLFDSGATASAAHIWNSSGAYQVRAMATNSKGASSEWSSQLEVTIEEGDIPDQIGVFRNGGLYFDANGDGYWSDGDTTGWFGATGDLSVAGDWDGDGNDEIAVFRNGGWYFDANGDGYWTAGDTTGWFGATGDLPAAGDWDGNGKDEIAVFRNGGWYFDANGDGYWTAGDTMGWFGATGDLPAAGDWNGNDKDEIAVFRNGGWYFDANGDGYWTTGDTTGWFGATGDLPAAGDWDGNGRDEIAVFRNGGWYFDANGDGYWTAGDTTGWFGAGGDRPVAGRWGLLTALALDNDKPQLDLREMSAEKIRQKRAALEELQEKRSNQIDEIKIAQETLLEKHRINSLKP